MSDDNIIDLKKARNNQIPSKPDHQPFLNLPQVTKFILLAIIVIHCFIAFIISDPDAAAIYLNFGFVPSNWTGAFDFQPITLVTPLTYMVLHGGWTHLIMNSAMLMAFGSGVEKWMGRKRFILFFITCGIISVVAEFALNPFSQDPIIGASGALSGLFAAVLVGLQKMGRLPTGRYGIWPFAVLWIVVSIIFGLIGGAFAGGPIAWIAHLGGFIGGLILMKLPYFKFQA